MTTDREIRTWLRESGHDVPERGRLGEEWRAVWAEANPDEPLGDNPGLSANEPGDGGPIPGQLEFETGEQKPVPPPGLGGKLLGGRREPRMRRPKARVSLESLAGGAWALLGNAAATQGLLPTARVLQMQAPVAGAILEDTLRGTVADKVLQPLARGQETASDLMALLGAPVIVTAISLRPASAPVLLPMLRSSMRQWLLIAGPRIKAKQRQEAKALRELGVEDGGMDELLDSMMAELFPAPGDWDGEAGLHAA